MKEILFYNVSFWKYGKSYTVIVIGNIDQVKDWAEKESNAYNTEYLINFSLWHLDDLTGIEKIINLSNNI